tara:strand:+ start:63 stop:587 length:525 start_codon:yes stop_codon:yes gene_type:complete
MYDRFEFEEIGEAIRITPHVFTDNRGAFTETYRHNQFYGVGVTEDFVQFNTSHSFNNVLRGMHWQERKQAKLVTCVAGEILDVFVDQRRGRTYGKTHSVVLNSAHYQSLYIPPLHAHGFYVQSEYAVVTYAVDRYYNDETERGVRWDTIDFDWPCTDPILSERDAEAPAMVPGL